MDKQKRFLEEKKEKAEEDKKKKEQQIPEAKKKKEQKPAAAKTKKEKKRERRAAEAYAATLPAEQEEEPSRKRAREATASGLRIFVSHLPQSTTDEEPKHKKDQPGQRAVRTALKLAGLNSIIARHAAATAIVAALDADRDGKLAREEMADASVAICRVHKALSARATSFTALARGLSTAAPAGYPPVSFLTDLASSRAADAIGDSARLESARAAARAADLSDAQVVTAEMAIAMAEAYVRLVPADVLPRQDEEGKGKTEL